MSHAEESSTFARVLCGVDGTPESKVAVRQARRLQDPNGSLVVAVAEPFAKAAHAGIAAPHATQLLHHEAETVLADALALAPAATAKLLNGDAATALLEEAAVEGATLVAVGTHGRRRAVGMVVGTVAARTIHEAPCSVLVARPARDDETWPRSVAVGVDGSAESAAAFEVARSIADRFGASVRAIAATDDQVDREAAEAIASELEEARGGAVDVLTAASDAADLVVVGSRGLHGLKTLGSVSERVAHEARSSVLVVRTHAR